MSLPNGTIDRRAVRCLRAHEAVRRLFLDRLKRAMARHPLRFRDPVCSPWGRAARLTPGREQSCPFDGRPVRPFAVVVLWKGFRWATVVGQCPLCDCVFFTRPSFTPDDYLGRAAGDRVRRRLLKVMGAV